jgi:hypothetical protein
MSIISISSKAAITPCSFRAPGIDEVDTDFALLGSTYCRGLKDCDGKKSRREGEKTRKHE